jgi:hypothetical protein
MDIFSRAHRTLKSVKNYVDLSGDASLPDGAPQLPVLKSSEEPVGAYISDRVKFSDLILFTTQAIYVHRAGRWDGVPLSAITGTRGPASKEEVSGFTLLLNDGGEFWLPVAGSHGGRFFDAFAVLRFVDRVIEDQRSQ